LAGSDHAVLNQLALDVQGIEHHHVVGGFGVKLRLRKRLFALGGDLDPAEALLDETVFSEAKDSFSGRDIYAELSGGVGGRTGIRAVGVNLDSSQGLPGGSVEDLTGYRGRVAEIGKGKAAGSEASSCKEGEAGVTGVAALHEK
jgi:hypothetical protein